MYQLQVKKHCVKSIEKLPERVKIQIRSVAVLLQNDPFDSRLDCKKLQTPFPGYRIRIGDYRMLYTIDTDARIIHIYDIGHRKSIYK